MKEIKEYHLNKNIRSIDLIINHKDKLEHDIKVFIYYRNQYSAYPITVTFLLAKEPIHKTVNNNEELEKFLIKYIESETTQKGLSYIDSMYEKKS